MCGEKKIDENYKKIAVGVLVVIGITLAIVYKRRK